MQEKDNRILQEPTTGGVLAPLIPSIARGRRVSHYATAEANVSLLAEALIHLSVTKYQLAHLLDIKPRSNVYVLAGGRRRMSNLLLVRLLRLFLMQAEGILVYDLRTIDWTTGVMVQRNGNVLRLPGLVPTAAPMEPLPASRRVIRRAGGPGGQQAGYPYGASGPVY
jgi:hypothetical protein